jgi:hypothetical protein
MFVSELFENIRMGYKDISRPSKKNYTYGVELEIIVSDDVYDETKIYNNLMDKHTNGSADLYLKSYISKNLIDDNVWNSAETLQEIIRHFQDVTGATLKDGARIKKGKNYYSMNYGSEKSNILVYSKRDFLDSILFGFDLTNLYNDKDYRKFLDKSIKNMIERNKDNYIVESKITYLENVMKDSIDIDNVEPDSSVPLGAEVISKVYDNLDNFLSDLKKSFDVIDKDENLSTDMTTGLHINIGTWNAKEIYNFDALKFFLIADTMGILKDFDRVGSDYAVPVGNKLKKAVEDFDIKEYFDISKDITAKILGGSDKFDDINLSKLPYEGYIEVRGFGNADYEKRFNDVKFHILKLIRVLDISQDPNAYKNDYMKKLIKFLESKTTTEGNLSDLQNLILNDFRKWGKPANRKAYSFDVESIDDMAKWIHGFIDSSRGNSTYIKKIGETIPLNLPINMMKFVYEKTKTGSYSFKTDFDYAKNLMEMIINEYYLQEESPKLEKALKRIFKI